MPGQFIKLPFNITLVNEETGEEEKFQFVYETILPFSNIGEVKLIVIKKELEDETGIVLVSNRRDWSADKIIRIYRNRWKIKTFYRNINQYLGFDKYYVRSLNETDRFWSLIFLSYTFVQYCYLFGIISSYINDSTFTFGDKLRRFHDLYMKSFIDLIVEYYELT